MDDPAVAVVGVLTLFIHRSLTGSDAVTYKLKGLEMIGMEGKYDFATHQISAKMLSDPCDVLEFAAPVSGGGWR